MRVAVTDLMIGSLRRPSTFQFSDTASENRKAARVRGALLPLEYDLERLVSNIVNPLPSWNVSMPAHQWEGVECSDGEVLEFVVECKKLEGSLECNTLPRSLTRFSVYKNKLRGELDLVNLPPHLCTLDASYNQFTGNIDLCHLPLTLTSLILSANKLRGHVTFTNLPSGMRNLSVRNNAELTGTVEVRLLPLSMKYKAFSETKILIRS